MTSELRGNVMLLLGEGMNSPSLAGDEWLWVLLVMVLYLVIMESSCRGRLLIIKEPIFRNPRD